MIQNKLNSFFQFIYNGIDYITIAFLVVVAMVFASPTTWKLKNYPMLISAFLMGAVTGSVAAYTPGLDDFSHFVAILGTITGPSTLVAIQGKTLTDVLKDILEVREKAKRTDNK